MNIDIPMTIPSIVMVAVALVHLAIAIRTKDQRYLRAIAILGWLFVVFWATMAGLAISQGGC